MPTLSVSFYSLVVVVSVGCGGSKPSSNEQALRDQVNIAVQQYSPHSPQTSQPLQVVLNGSAEPPALTQAMLQADATNPDVVVSGDNPWVVVPSFRLAIQLPVGWYRKSPEQILAGIARSYDAQHQPDQAERDQLVRGLRGAADRHPENAAVMGLIPSVRVVVAPGGGVPPEDFCARFSIPASQQMYPDARLTGASWTTVHGRRATRCSIAVTANTMGGSYPGLSEELWIFGDTHYVLVIAVGNASDPMAEILQACAQSIRQVAPISP